MSRGPKRLRLPLHVQMREGNGPRRDDCNRYADCIGEFARAIGCNLSDRQGHCPIDCKSFEPSERDSELAHMSHSRPHAVEFPAPVYWGNPKGVGR